MKMFFQNQLLMVLEICLCLPSINLVSSSVYGFLTHLVSNNNDRYARSNLDCREASISIDFLVLFIDLYKAGVSSKLGTPKDLFFYLT